MPLYAANKERNYMGVTFAMYTCVKMDAILPTIMNIKLLIIFLFFKTSLDNSQNLFMSIVRLV